MAETTLTLETQTKERLNAYRHQDHDSWTEVIEGLMQMLPTVDDVQDGCARCGENPYSDIPSEEIGGYSRWFNQTVNNNTIYYTGYYCSSDCLVAAAEDVDKHFPEYPDLVRVGGNEELATEFEGASFYMDGDVQEIGLPVPGAFSGTDIDGDEYKYTGEPVYIKNQGDWVFSGVIETIIHEDAHTGILLGSDIGVETRNHPDDEKRQEDFRNQTNTE